MFALTRKKTLIILAAGSFFVAFMGGRHLTESRQDSLPFENKSFLSFATSKDQNHYRNQQQTNDTDIISFIKKLQGPLNFKTLNELFNEAFFPKKGFTESHMILQGTIVYEWGKVAPKQCMEKLKDVQYPSLFTFSLFAGWASKDPEAAIAFYEENGKNKPSQERSEMLSAISAEYAKHSPKKAWNWLQKHKDDVFEEDFDDCKRFFVSSFALAQPQLIPEFINTADSQEIEHNLYDIGFGWGNHDSESQEWINHLPGDFRAQAQAGRIMGLSGGNLEKINEQLAKISQEERTKVIKVLSDPILKTNAIDMVDKINWMITSFPESEIPENARYTISSWLKKNKQEAADLASKLPPSLRDQH